MFKGMDLTNVDKIDFCGMATRMEGTFENAKLDIIDIIGTENVETFGECFKHSRLETLTGIDTSSATTCNSMFMGATTQNNGRLKLPKFDLSNCTNIGGMFQNTNIAGVTMVNTGKVQVAAGCYTNCPYLVSYPPTKFDSITDIKQLTGTEELIDMFAGCSSLTNQQMLSKSSTVDFEAELAATAEFYSRPKSLFDSDGYYIVKSSADMNSQFYQKNKKKIDKIKIAGDISIQNGAAGAFNYGTEIYAKAIDLSGVRNASRLFAAISFKRVPVLLGTERIEHADYMFQGCHGMAIAPALTLPNVKTFNGLYMGCTSLHQLPELTVGRMFSDDIDQLGETEYMFGADITGMAAHCGEQRIKNFAKKIRRQVTDALVFDVPADGVIRTSEMTNQFGKASVFIEKCRKYAPETFAKIKKVFVDTEAQCMFAGLNLPDADFPPVEFGKPEEWSDISGMFSNAKLKSLKGFSLPTGCTVANALFAECQIKEGFPMLDFKGVTEANGAFAGAKSDVRWQSAPKMSDIKYANELFAESNVLPKKFVFDDLDLNSAILLGKAFAKIDSEFVIKSYFNKNLASAADMFSGCKGLKSIGVWNVVPQNQCNMSHAFENSGVVEIGAIRMASNSVGAFARCEDLTKIRLLYADGANDLTAAFNGCRRLVNILWYNINKNLQGLTANMFANCPLAGLFGISCEKYLKSQYKPVIPKAVDIFQVKR